VLHILTADNLADRLVGCRKRKKKMTFLYSYSKQYPKQHFISHFMVTV